jgi:hypothetical protein
MSSHASTPATASSNATIASIPRVAGGVLARGVFPDAGATGDEALLELESAAFMG